MTHRSFVTDNIHEHFQRLIDTSSGLLKFDQIKTNKKGLQFLKLFPWNTSTIDLQLDYLDFFRVIGAGKI